MKVKPIKQEGISCYQPLLKLGDFILVNGDRRKVNYIANTGLIEWNFGWATIQDLKFNENRKSKIRFVINN